MLYGQQYPQTDVNKSVIDTDASTTGGGGIFYKYIGLYNINKLVIRYILHKDKNK